MTREEQLKRKIENIEKKGERALATAKLFIELEGNVSDIDLANKLKERGIETSSSTVGRDLTENLRNYYIYQNKKAISIPNMNEDEVILTDEQKRIIEYINKKRTLNKYEGKVKGGVNSASKNEYIRDKNNHFKGSKKRV